MRQQYNSRNNHPYSGFLQTFAFAFTFLMAISAYCVSPGTLTLAANSSGTDIQKALDQLPQGGEVVLPPGTYEIHQPIVLQHDNQILRGSGTDTILFLAANANCPVIILGSPIAATGRATRRIFAWLIYSLMATGKSIGGIVAHRR